MSCHHCNLMDGYYAARHAQEQRAEAYSQGYASETEEFYRDVEPRIVFKEWLQGQRNSAW